MYESFYELRKPPFRLTPDPHFFFGSHTHKRSLAYLRYAVQQGEGFVVITGGPGTGKTELMLNLIEEFPQHRSIFAKIVSTNLNADDLLQLVAASFKLSTDGLGKGVLLKKLEDFFISCARQGKQVFLLIDEAHNLPISSLMELSMLSNFQLGEKAIMRCFLLGQEPLEQKLEEPGLAHLKQRIIASTHLDPMDEAETRGYVEHRLTRAGWKGNPRFHDNAYPPIYRFTGGIPRQINFFCNRLLLQGYIDELDEIDIGVVRCVVKELLEEATVAHAPCDLAEIFVEPGPPPDVDTSVHQHNRPRTVNAGTQDSRTPAPPLKIAAIANPAQEPILPIPDHLVTGTALITSHAGQTDADTFQELAHGGAHRLLRTLTEVNQADRQLRARAAFYVEMVSARDTINPFLVWPLWTANSSTKSHCSASRLCHALLRHAIIFRQFGNGPRL